MYRVTTKTHTFNTNSLVPSTFTVKNSFSFILKYFLVSIVEINISFTLSCESPFRNLCDHFHIVSRLRSDIIFSREYQFFNRRLKHSVTHTTVKRHPKHQKESPFYGTIESAVQSIKNANVFAFVNVFKSYDKLNGGSSKPNST